MDFQTLESIREAYHQKSRKIWRRAGILLLIMVLLVVGLCIGTQIAQGDTPSSFVMVSSVGMVLGAGIFVLIITLIVASFATRKEALAYRHAYKAYFVDRILRQMFTDVYYDHAKGLGSAVLLETRMIGTGDAYSSNDLTMGTYKNVKFAQADVHIQVEERDNDGNSHYVTVFMGRWMIFEFPKKFNFRMAVASKKFGGALQLRRGKNDRKFQKIETESVDFNRNFVIYAEDGFEAFYILDPAFMTKIENIAKEHPRCMLCFYDNRLYVGINDGNDSFEPPAPSKPIDEQAESAKIMKDIKVVTDLVEGLSLEKKLFTENS